ncbi:dienelactone hydrolase endo-1,3,1,4-beta-D-glucanase [Mycena floridula]|nr:dienelactone hydrolase endo-1,3,1,4-beta-D-glucanase [Mycena floridula]
MSCPDCFKGAVLDGEPKGVILSDLQGAYLAASPNGNSKIAILFLTDVFGLPLKNSKLLADQFAAALQVDVYAPDLFAGDVPVRPDQLNTPERVGEKMSLLGWIKLIFNLIPGIPSLYRSRPSVVDQRISSFIEKLQAEKKYEKIGAVGQVSILQRSFGFTHKRGRYCFGGSVGIRLGATDMVNSIVICHPGQFTMEQVKAIKVPAAWACAEEDMGFSKEKRLQCEAEFESRKGKENFVEYEFTDYKGTTHGFAARPNLSYPEVKIAFEGAFEQSVNWFKKTLF